MAIEGSPLKNVFGLPFKEQIEHFQRKLHLPTAKWNDIEQSAHDRGFVVAGAQKADLLADLHASIAKHMAGGGGLAGYRKDFRKIVEQHGWHGWTGEGTKGGEAWRTKVTYMTNLRVSHAAGRYRQLVESGIKWLMWKHSGLAKEPRAQHLAWDGLVLPADHPFWKRHFPPQIPPHWGCRCRVVGVTNPALARILGGDPDKPLPKGWDKVDAKYKTQGPDWNYAPGANALMPLAEMVENKLFNLPAPIGAAMWEALAPAIAMERRLAWTSMVSATAASMQAGNQAALAHVAAPATVADLAARGVPLVTADIWLRDAELLHALREAKAGRGAGLSEATWRELPALLEKATPYLDTVDAGIVYVFDAPEGLGKVAVRVNYASKVRAGGKRDRMTSNFIRTGGLVEEFNITAGGRYELLKK
jgi:hypothetical protein